MPASVPDVGEVHFVQNRRPALEAGEYRLSVKQVVNTGAGGETFTEDRRFVVAGEHFQIDPTEVDSVFPPAYSEGDYINVLPHLVLNRPMLPWLRSPTRGEAPVDPVNGNVPTWLALLVIDEHDPQPMLTATTLNALRTSGTDIASYPLSDPLPWGLSDADPIMSLDLAWDLFKRIAPSLDDLDWLASVRVVTGQQSGTTTDDSSAAEYAVLIANRLPQSGHKTTVHLVSLDGMAPYLPGGRDPPRDEPRLVRLVSLYRWNFTASEEPVTFGDVIEALKPGLRPFGLLPPPPPDSTYKQASEGYDLGLSSEPVGFAAAMGYVGVPHLLRDGGQIASWYRGPFSPRPIARTLADKLPAAASDTLLRFDPASGLLDASYAAAWQLGRMLAVADRDYAQRLYRWKHATAVAGVRAAEHAVLESALPDEQEDPVQPAPPPVNPTALHARLSAFARSGAAALIGMPSPTAPTAVAADPAEPDDGTAPPVQIVDWVDRLRHLHGVPFTYLVPYEAMLGAEDIRFFHVDLNWLDALADGAFSIGEATAGDAVAVRGASTRQAPAARSSQTVTGFLLRSFAVKHWPGLQVSLRDRSGGTLRTLRYDKLAPDVILCLADGLLGSVDIQQPPEGLHFGVDLYEHPRRADGTLPPIVPGDYHKFLRDPVTGADVGQAADIHPLPWRSKAGDAIDMNAIAIAAAAKKTEAAPFTSAGFALTMVEGVDSVTFDACLASGSETALQ